MHFLLHQLKMAAPLVAELSICYGECFTFLILPPVYFFIYVFFFSAKLSRFCPRYLTETNQHLTS